MGTKEKLIQLAIKHKGEYQEVLKSYKNNDDIFKHYSCTSNILIINEEKYPSYFYNLECPPLVLFYYGDLKYLSYPLRIGIIGSRNPSYMGINMIDDYIGPCLEKLVLKGERPVIVNGMAKGIDVLAARKAMEYQLPIIMFLGSGIDNIYPKVAKDVYEYCKEGKGLIMSEYPNMSLPLAYHFPFRNRLIASCSKKIILPEAKMPSGSYQTVNHGIYLGKEIGTFPKTLEAEPCLNNILISEGATIILSVDELFEFMYNSLDIE